MTACERSVSSSSTSRKQSTVSDWNVSHYKFINKPTSEVESKTDDEIGNYVNTTESDKIRLLEKVEMVERQIAEATSCKKAIEITLEFAQRLRAVQTKEMKEREKSKQLSDLEYEWEKIKYIEIGLDACNKP